MRELFPTGSKIPSISPSSGSVFTEEQYEQLLSQIDELREELAADKIDLDTFKHNLEQAVTTITVTSENVRTNILNATTAVLTHLAATDITAPDAEITRLIADAITGDTAAFRALTSTDITSTNATISNLNATEATIQELHTTTFNPASVSTTDLTATNATITNETVDKSTVNDATITNADINKAEVVELKSDEADILEAEINQIYAKNLNVKYITHKEQYNRQEVTTASTSADGDYWIILPKFLNGSFNILAKSDTNEILWSMEVMNSTRNIAFRWSVNDDYIFLKDVDLVLDAESCQEFIQIHANTNGLATFLYYRADSYDTEVTPTIYAVKQYDATDPLKHFEFNRAAGTWLPNSVFAGEFHADSMIIDETVFEKITLNHDLNLPTAYDQYGNPINYTAGTPGQYVTPTVDEYDHTGIQWKEPVDNRTPSEVDETRTLITEATLGNYTGEMTAEKITETVDTYSDVLTDGSQFIKVEDNYFPILDKRLVPAHRDVYSVSALTQEEAEALIATGLYYIGDAEYVQITSINVEDKLINGTDFSSDWDIMDVYSEEHPETYYITYNGDEHVASFPLTVYVNNGVEYNIVHTGDGTVVHGDATINNDLEVKRDIEVDRNVNIGKNTAIGGNLTVADEYVNPDDPTDRQNNAVEVPNVTVRDYIKNKHLFIGKGVDKPNNLKDDAIVIAEGAVETQTLVYTDGTGFYKEDTTATTQPSGIAGTPTVIGDFVNDTIWYKKVSDTWYEVDDFIDNTNWTEVSDSELIAILDAATPVTISEVIYTETTYGNAQLTRQTTIDNATKIDEIAVRNSDYDDWVHAAHKPLVYNMPRRAIEPTDEISIDDVKADTVITNDLYVNRKAYINYQVEQEVEGNYLTLRANNNAGMTSGEYSGFLVNNYQAGKICAVVVDNEGMVRVGNATGASTTYPDLYYKLADDKYYTDAEFTTEVNPTGVLLAWDDVETTSTYKYWKNAVWKALTFTSTEPLLTRDEVLDMSDAALLRWDATGKKAKTIPLPTINGQKLVGTITVDDTDPLNPVTTYGYDWAELEPGTFIFDTVEDYEAALLIPEGQTGYIPNKSHIIIRGNYDTVLGV